MKVTHLVTFFEPAYYGGIQRYAGEVARRQRRQGVDASIFTVNLPRRKPPERGQAEIEWNKDNKDLPVSARNAWGIFQRTPFYPPLLAELRHIEADVVHLHGPSPWFEFALRVSRPRAKIVFNVHNSFPVSSAAERWLSRGASALMQSTMASADAVIVPSRAFLAEVAPAGSLKHINARVHTVAPGVDHIRFYPLGRPKDEGLVLFVGHIRREKGLHVLVEALAGLPACRLLVLGSVSYESAYFREVRHMAEEKLGSRATFKFNPDYGDLLEAYNKAGCVVAPSIGLESWNLVLLEAAACGAACVRTDLPGMMWADFARVAPAGDPLALAQVIAGALTQRVQLGEAARKAASGYSWENTTADIMSIYEAVSA